MSRGKEAEMVGAKGKRIFFVAVVVLLAAAAGALVGGCGADSGKETVGPQVIKDVGKEEGETARTGTVSSTEVEGQGYADLKQTSPSPSSTGGLPELKPKIIKNGLVKLETGKGGYAGIRQEAVSLASSAGGYLEGEDSSRDDRGLTYATLTLRVPADRFDQVMEAVSSLGEVVSSKVSTSDVSGEYVDLESRLRHLQAEESFYLSLIGQARGVQEMISIREHLSSVQLEKERVQGRMSFLDRQVAYSTLTISVSERGPEEKEGFWSAVARAFRSFGRGMRALAIGLFYVLPYLVVIAVVIAAVWWLTVRRKRGGATP